MNRIVVRLAVALAALVLVGRSDAQSPSQKPMLLVTIKSLKDVLTKVKDLTKSTMETLGQGAMWPMIEAGLDSKLGKNGEKIPGLDPSKPLGLRVMYRAPTGSVPVDGDILLMLPATDANKLIADGLPMLGMASPAPGDGGATTFTVGTTKAYAREANGYVCVTIADASVVSADRLPKPSDVFGEAKHDIAVSLNLSMLSESSLRELFKMLQAKQGVGGEGLSDRDLQQIAQLEEMAFNFDVDASAGKVLLEVVQDAKPNSTLSAMMKSSVPGPVKSSIGLSPTAVLSMVMRGEYTLQNGLIANYLEIFKRIPNLSASPAGKSVMELLQELASSDVEDMSFSISGDGTAVFGASLKSTAAFELKVGELLDKVVPEIQKDAGENAGKVKEMSKKDAVTLSDVKLSRLWIPLGKKADTRAVSIYFGVKDNVAFAAVTLLEFTETIENALKQKPIDDHDPFTLTVKLKELGEAFLILNYKGSGEIKAVSQGGDPFKTTLEIPVKDIAELFKLGLGQKIMEKFGVVKPGDDG